MDFREQKETPTQLRDVRPSSFSHVNGQDHVKQALQIAVDAHFQEGASRPLEDILLCGPPGLGKTALLSGNSPSRGGGPPRSGRQQREYLHAKPLDPEPD